MHRKKGRVNVNIDMTPMVDVIMLLLTFFMMTTQFRPPEAADVTIPTSNSEFKLPEGDVMTVLVDKSGKIFLKTDDRTRMLMMRAASDDTEKESFKGLEEGLEMRDQNNLADLMIRARVQNPKLRTVVKGDKDTPYGNFQDVMDTLQKVKITRFALVTEMERG
jgi:biopolymer transport protein ExbD